MYKVLGILVLIAIGFGAYYFMRNNLGSTNNNQNQQEQPNQQANNPTPPPAPVAGETTMPEKAVAVVETNQGTFEITLDGKAAPKTVANFIKLSKEKYYENTKFHRIIASFMIQGGDPNSKDNDPSNDGLGGPGYTIPAEIGLKHNQYAVATARQGDQVNPTKASSGSQFFIVTEESPQTHTALDGNYTVFGYVTKGMDVIDKIALTPVDFNPYSGEQVPSLPLEDVVIKKITIKE